MNSTENVFTSNRAGAPFQESDSISDDPSGENNSKTNLSFEVENSDSNSDEDVNSDDTRFPSLKLVCSPKTPPTIPENVWEYSVDSGPETRSLKFKPIQIQSPILEFKHGSTTFVEENDVCALACDNSESTLNVQGILQDTKPSFIFPQSTSDYLSQEQKLCHDGINGFQPEDCKNGQLLVTPTNCLHFNVTNNLCVTLPVDLVVANAAFETNVVDTEPLGIDSAPEQWCINLSHKEMQGDAYLVVNTAELDKEIVSLRALPPVKLPRTSENTELTGSSGIDTAIKPSYSNTRDLSSELKGPTLDNMAIVYDVKNIGMVGNNASSTDQPEKSFHLNTANHYISSIKSLLFPGWIAECNEIDSTDLVKPEAIKSTASLLDILTGKPSVINTNPIQSPLLVSKQNRTEVEPGTDVYCKTLDNTSNSAKDCLWNVEHRTDMFVPDASFSDCNNFQECDVYTDKGNSTNLCTEVVKQEYLKDMILSPSSKLLPHPKCDITTMSDEINYAQSSMCLVQSQDINAFEETTVNDSCEMTQSTLEYVSSNPPCSSLKQNGLHTIASCSYVEVVSPGIKTNLESRETILGLDFNQITDTSRYNLQISGKNITCLIPIESESSVLSEDAEVTTCLSNTNLKQTESPIAGSEDAEVTTCLSNTNPKQPESPIACSEDAEVTTCLSNTNPKQPESPIADSEESEVTTCLSNTNPKQPESPIAGSEDAEVTTCLSNTNPKQPESPIAGSEDAEVTTCLSNTNPKQPESPIAGSESAGRSVVYSPPLFSDEEDFENSSSVNSLSRLHSRSDTSGCRTVEQRRLKQIQESLIGVFPPPSVTMPQLGVDDMLKLLKESDLFLKPVSLIAPDVENEESICDRLEPAMESEWPAVKFVSYPDIHYNNGPISEKFELLSLKYSQRYVGCETASSCNIWSSFSSSNCSNVRNKRLGAGHSPGRRLSHLARRRKAFSRDSLIAHNNVPKNQANPVAERRQIVVNKKSGFKLGNSQGQNGRIPAIGAGPMTHKRALFQSPDNLKKALQIKSNSASKRKNETNRAVAPSYKRALFSSGAKHSNFPSNSEQTSLPEVDKRRNRDDSHLVASSSKRKLVFGTSDASRSGNSQVHIGTSTSGNNEMHPNSTSGKETSGASKKRSCVSTSSSSCVLSSSHKKKLLWAVAEALRGKGINIRHTSFKQYASSLARTCRVLLPAAIKATNGSTSEIMLQLANQQIGNIMLSQEEGHSVCKF